MKVILVQDVKKVGKKGDGTGKVTLSALDTSIEKDSDADKEYNIKGEFIANGVKTAVMEKGFIGALSGAWMVSGVVPTLIYYGIQIYTFI